MGFTHKHCLVNKCKQVGQWSIISEAGMFCAKSADLLACLHHKMLNEHEQKVMKK